MVSIRSGPIRRRCAGTACPGGRIPSASPGWLRPYQRAFSRPWSYTRPELVTDPTIDALRAAQRAGASSPR